MTAMLAASTGGHLQQLHQLAPRLLAADEHRVWVTFDTPQSRSLLSGEEVLYVPYIAPRDWRGVLVGLRLVARYLGQHDVRVAYSTGSALALAVLPVARMRGVASSYIESAARSTGPSVTGRVLAVVPGIRTYTQYLSWATARWPYLMSVFDEFRVDDAVVSGTPDRPPQRVLVTLGTIEGYGFRRLVQRVLAIVPPGVDVVWQTGWGDVTDLGVDGPAYMPQRDLVQAMREADVVVAHAGVGSALTALGVGACPVLVPRRRAHGEHVDDHQQQIAGELALRGLAVAREADELTWSDLVAAAGTRVTRASDGAAHHAEPG